MFSHVPVHSISRLLRQGLCGSLPPVVPAAGHSGLIGSCVAGNGPT